MDDRPINALHRLALGLDPSLTITRETIELLADATDPDEIAAAYVTAVLRLEDLIRNQAEYSRRD
jgi:hypothetical protein